jgi:tRNA pseudouridine55 synthase
VIVSSRVVMDGLIVVDKPGGCTSHDIVLRVRHLLKIRKAGHCGTLDPDATGILLVAVGRGVRFFPYLSRQDKTYEGTIRLGFSTETYDASGRPTSPESRAYPTELGLLEAMRRWEGEILQIPPIFSAKKVGGQPMHRLARAGREVRGQAARVVIREFRLLEYSPPDVVCHIVSSSGTYIRSLAHDLGRDLGCGAHLKSLRRTAVGPYSLRAAWTMEGIEKEARDGLRGFLIPLEDLLPEIPGITLGPEDEGRIRNGKPVSLEPGHLPAPTTRSGDEPALVRLFNASGKLVAMARISPENERILPFLVIPPSP